MRHLNSGRKLKRTASHKRALLRNMASSLFEHKKIHTTLAKANELRPYAEQLITKAKHALQREQAGQLPEGHTIDLHSRRVVAREIQQKAILQELFDTIAPQVIDRNGGYCRIVKTGTRRGDAGKTAIIELVDWNTEIVGTPKKAKKAKAPKAETTVAAAATTAAAVATATQAEELFPAASEEVVDTVEETVEVQAEEVVETANEEVSAESNEEVAAEETSNEESNTESTEATDEENKA